MGLGLQEHALNYTDTLLASCVADVPSTLVHWFSSYNRAAQTISIHMKVIESFSLWDKRSALGLTLRPLFQLICHEVMGPCMDEFSNVEV